MSLQPSQLFTDCSGSICSHLLRSAINSASKRDGELPWYWPFAVGITHCCIKMVDKTNNKKELEMQRNEPLLHLLGTHRLTYGKLHHYYCKFKSLNAESPVRTVFSNFCRWVDKFIWTDQTDCLSHAHLTYEANEESVTVPAFTWSAWAGSPHNTHCVAITSNILNCS